MGTKWIYPNNLPIRGYQKSAVEKSLFNNSLIVLPTGFGKTFIAAVVMYNYYLWYPQGTIIFVAPTRPLVAQQINECKKISGIPSSQCTELTGMTTSEKRAQLWERKRVIFATPQVIENDLENEILPSERVRLIVIDEAHRAQGGFAYVNIVRQLHQDNQNGFRVLALSATPGSDIQRIKQVMVNLLINHVMFRSENSIDLSEYKNEKTTKAWTVELTGKHKELVHTFIKICDPIFKELHRAGLTYNFDSVDKVHKYLLVSAMKGNNNNARVSKGRASYLCQIGMKLSQEFEYLALYGIRQFYGNIMRSLGETRSAIKTFLAANMEFDSMLEDIRKMFGDDLTIDADRAPRADLLQGHPKLRVTKDIISKHFVENENKTESRVIVFAKYRETVQDIAQALKAFEPEIQARIFVGQASASGGQSAGMRQREQKETLEQFRRGEFNVLVATCVAEEGLDIGEVDLIICYDTSSSPISNTQRRGRTGRKRAGCVHTLLTQGYEEKKLRKAGATRRQVEDQLFKRDNYISAYYKNAPRMVPNDLTPTCFEQMIFPVDDEPKDDVDGAVGRKRRQRRLSEIVGEPIDCGSASKRRKKKKDKLAIEAEEADRAAAATTSSESQSQPQQPPPCDWDEAEDSDDDFDITFTSKPPDLVQLDDEQ